MVFDDTLNHRIDHYHECEERYNGLLSLPTYDRYIRVKPIVKLLVHGTDSKSSAIRRTLR